MSSALGCISSAVGSIPVSGEIFTWTTQPLSTHFNRTPVARHRDARGDVKQLEYRGVSIRVRIRWDDNAIGTIAREAGMAEVWYADFEYLSILGIWTQERVNLYGRYADEPLPEPPRAKD